GILRFVCHVISGATVWAGLSIPTNAALIYSIGYNATYMIPETIITAVLAYYIGSVLDFRADPITAFSTPQKKSFPVLKWIGGLILSIALIVDVRFVFSNLQNAETGDFDITGLSRTNWSVVLIVTAVAVALAVVLFFAESAKSKKA
ncbi:MAG: energy-coupled thiamine transporter ThiT, partial [Lachnospiraceae bacterium]|nr:energy-coupled thiamine transporter ThiT [Lachnospiraceae bacterium]